MGVAWLRVGALLASVGATIGVVPARAIVIRHDVLDIAYLNYAAQPQFAGVGQVYAGPAISSGALIRPTWVLTAAHVADNGPVATISFKVGGVSYAAAAVAIYPTWDGVNVYSGDVALIRLATAVPGIARTELYTGSGEVGMTGSYTGTGLTGTGLTGWGPYDGRTRAGTNLIDGADSQFLFATFNSPATGALGLECGLATGDSGSGMFVQVGGVWLIAGINSWVSDTNGNGVPMDYGDRMAVTRVSAFWAWVYSTICPADADGNGRIEPVDVAVFVNRWLASVVGGTLEGDFDHNGAVQPADVGVYVNAWLGAVGGGC